MFSDHTRFQTTVIQHVDSPSAALACVFECCIIVKASACAPKIAKKSFISNQNFHLKSSVL